MHGADNRTTLICQLSGNLGSSTCWNCHGLPRHLTGIKKYVCISQTCCIAPRTGMVCSKTNSTEHLTHVYILITNLMHWLLFIHKTLFSSPCFEPQVLIIRRIQLYTCSIWYCHSVNRWVVGGYSSNTRPLTCLQSDSTICCTYTTVSSWWWALEARNM